jgi:uncharacterized delta-60 repeat protein
MFLSSFARRALHHLAGKSRLALFASVLAFSVFQTQGQIIITNFFSYTNRIQLSSNAFQVSESGGFYEVRVDRNVGPIDPLDPFSDFALSSDVTVDYSVTDGTARNLVDYKAVSGKLEFAPYQETAYFTIPIYDNSAVDGDRTAIVTLDNPQINNGFGFGFDVVVLGSPSSAVLTIFDDEGPSNAAAAGSVQWSSATYEAFHDESLPDIGRGDGSALGAVVTIVRPGGTKGRILIDWQTSTEGLRTNNNGGTNFGFFFSGRPLAAVSGPGGDFDQTSGTVALNDYQMSANITIPLRANPLGAGSPYTTNLLAGFSDISDKQFNVLITGVRAAPGEDTAVVQPQIGARSKAAVYIRNNAWGLGFSFERAHYTFNEGNPSIVVWVKRSPNLNPDSTAVSVHYTQNPLNVTGDFLANTWPLDAQSDYATPVVDFGPNDGILTWSETDGDLKKAIVLPIVNDSEVEFNEDLYFRLYKLAGEQDGFVNPSAGRCHATIRFDDQPAGSYDRTFNLDNSASTTPPFNSAPGANFDVNAMVAQPDGKILIGGDFNNVNGTPRNRIARMNNTGTLDESFNPGVGADGGVHAVALQTDGKVLIGGDFTSVNGTERYGIARLNTNGVLDTTFNPGRGARDFQGFESTVRTIAIQESGKILIGGEFTSFNGTNVNYLARLNSDGSLDSSFAVDGGPDGPIYSIGLGSGGMEIKGNSSGVNPPEQHFGPYDSGSKSGLITLDYTFINQAQLRIYYDGNVLYDTGRGTNSQTITIPYSGNSSLIEVAVDEDRSILAGLWYFTLKIQPDSDPNPVIGGNFTTYAGSSANYIARITPDGVLDQSFKTGTGADGIVYSVTKQGNKVILGGGFTSIDLRSRNGIARLNENGSLDTTYTPGSGANDSVYAVSLDRTGKVLLGGLFTSINTTRRVGIARLNFDGTVDTTFMDTAYNQFAGLINPFSPEVSPENFLRTIIPYRLTNATIFTNIVIDIATGETNITIATNYTLKDQIFIGGHFSQIGGGFLRDDVRRQTSVTRLIGGETPGPGNIGFVQTTYNADEAAGSTFITLVRTNGSLAEAHATFATADLPAGSGIAKAGNDYAAAHIVALWDSTYGQGNDRQVSSARMGPNFLSFDTNRTTGDFVNYVFPASPGIRTADNGNNKIRVSILDDTQIEGDELATMSLATSGSSLQLGGVPIPAGTALGLAEARLVIADNDFSYGSLGFSSPTYTVNEDEGTVTITVTRVGGTTGASTVHYDVQNGSATAGSDYTRVFGDLTFDSGKDKASFKIPIINDTTAELEETVLLSLSRPNGFATLDPARTNAVLTIIDNDFAPGRISFLNQNFNAGEADGQVTVTVQRRGGSQGDVTVAFATSNITARAGIDYVPTNGVLHWVSGDISPRTFTVTIIPNDIIEPVDNKFGIVLSDPIVSSSLDPRLLGNVPVATVTIVNDDSSGGFAFSQPVFNVDENGGEAIITVLRKGGSAGTNRVSYAVTNLASGGAIAGKDFIPVSGILNFGSNEVSRSFVVPIVNNSDVDGDRGIQLTLSAPALGTIVSSNSVLTIIDDEIARTPAGTVDTAFNATGTDDFIYSLAQQQDQSLIIAGDFVFINNVARNRIARLLDDGTVDTSFDPGAGANGSIRSITLENDERVVLGGLFQSVNGTNRNYLARINSNASVDPTFNPGSSTDNPIFKLAVQDDGKIIAVGSFTSFNGQSRNGVVRILTNGLVDPFFVTGTGSDAPVYTAAIQSDGKILLGGGFTRFNGQSINNLVRVNRNGSIDTTFKPGAGPDGSVRSIAIQSDGKIVIGGLFHHVGNASLNEIARLNPDGSIDTTFNPGSGANGSVGVIRVQIDGKLVLGGDFTQFNGVTRNRITRLNPDGSNDSTINFGSGANGTVADILIEANRDIVLVGGFTEYNGISRGHIARIHGGSLAGPGFVEFASPAYSVKETATNALVTLRRTGGTTGAITVDYQTIPGTAIPGIDYTTTQGTATFAEGETQVTVKIPVIVNPATPGDKTFDLRLSNPSDGSGLGLQPTSTVTIKSDFSVVGFDSPTYSITEDATSRSVAVTVKRTGANSGTATVTAFTADGTGRAGVNYAAFNQPLVFNPGDVSKTFSIPIFDDNLVDADKTFSVNLTNLVSASGRATIGLAQTIVTVINVQIAPGNLGFKSPEYSVVEGSEGTRTSAAIVIQRSGGSSGVVSIDYATTTNGTAAAGSKFVPTSGTLSFADGETEKAIQVQVIGNNIVEGNQTIGIKLSNPQGGAALVGSATVFLTIVDDDFGPGSVDLTFDPGSGAASGKVRTLVLESTGKMLIGGDFTNYNGTTRGRIARVNYDGSLDLGFASGTTPNGSIAALALQSGQVLIGGGFTMVDNLITARIARLSSSGLLDSSFRLPLGLTDEVSAIVVQSDGKVLIGGKFEVASAATRRHIARLNADGTVDSSFEVGSGTDQSVNAIAVDANQNVLIGGAFNTVNGIAQAGIARLRSTGTLDTSFQASGVNGSVNAVQVLKDGKILIAGSFTSVSGTNRSRIARLNPNGSLDLSFNPPTIDQPIRAFDVQSDGKIFIGGDFTSLNSLTRNRIARLSADGSIETGDLGSQFNSGAGANDTVLDLAIQSDGKVVIVGAFTTVDGVARRGIARLNGDPVALPRIDVSTVRRSNGQITFNFSTEVGRNYIIERSSDFVTWDRVTGISAQSTSSTFTESANGTAEFYRIRLAL